MKGLDKGFQTKHEIFGLLFLTCDKIVKPDRTHVAYQHEFHKKSEERSSFLWQILSCILIGLLIIDVSNFQRFSDRSFVSAFELIFILKLH